MLKKLEVHVKKIHSKITNALKNLGVKVQQMSLRIINVFKELFIQVHKMSLRMTNEKYSRYRIENLVECQPAKIAEIEITGHLPFFLCRYERPLINAVTKLYYCSYRPSRGEVSHVCFEVTDLDDWLSVFALTDS